MKAIRILGITSITILATALPAFANPAPLIAAAIQGFLLTSTAVAATATGAIATVAANAIVLGAADGGFTLLSERRHDRG